MSSRPWNIKNLLKVTTNYLKKKQIENPRLTAEVLLACQLKQDRVNLYLNFDKSLTEHELFGYQDFIRRRVKREPLQYITGVQEFWSLDFRVNSQVLIPRPESELLVEHGLKIVNGLNFPKGHAIHILDMGTGSGALAIALAHELPDAVIFATDISQDAIDLAKENAKKHGVLDKIQFKQGDLWQSLNEQYTPFDLIISNPPYIATDEYSGLPPEVRDYEPHLALHGHNDGIFFIEKIISGALTFMRHGAWLLVEMAPWQTEKALELYGQMQAYDQKMRIKDYSQHYRIAMGRKA